MYHQQVKELTLSTSHKQMILNTGTLNTAHERAKQLITNTGTHESGVNTDGTESGNQRPKSSRWLLTVLVRRWATGCNKLSSACSGRT